MTVPSGAPCLPAKVLQDLETAGNPQHKTSTRSPGFYKIEVCCLVAVSRHVRSWRVTVLTGAAYYHISHLHDLHGIKKQPIVRIMHTSAQKPTHTPQRPALKSTCNPCPFRPIGRYCYCCCCHPLCGLLRHVHIKVPPATPPAVFRLLPPHLHALILCPSPACPSRSLAGTPPVHM